VLVYEPDLSPAAMMDAMAREAGDPTLSEAERMQILGQLAAVDFSYGRLDEAAAKYGVLYDYYTRGKAPAMQALVLQGVGDILRKAGNLPLARERYGQGLTHALETQSLPLMLSLSYNVGDTSLALKNWADADGHLDVAQTIAGKMLNPQLQADAMEKMGIARFEEKRFADAVAIWNQGAEVCRGCNHRDTTVQHLGALVGGLRRQSQSTSSNVPAKVSWPPCARARRSCADRLHPRAPPPKEIA
jgi:tetratricopeptide (TPR) repeat protein